MDIIKECIDRIQKQITAAKLKKHGNEWNVANQLIDIAAADQKSAEIIMQDLDNKELSVVNVVKEVTAKRYTDPFKVMEELCRMYAVPVPEELPPEWWRTQGKNNTESKTDSGKGLNIDLSDLLD